MRCLQDRIVERFKLNSDADRLGSNPLHLIAGGAGKLCARPLSCLLLEVKKLRN